MYAHNQFSTHTKSPKKFNPLVGSMDVERICLRNEESLLAQKVMWEPGVIEFVEGDFRLLAVGALQGTPAEAMKVAEEMADALGIDEGVCRVSRVLAEGLA